MLHAFPYIALLAQLAVVPTTTVHRAPDGPSIIPFDTTIATTRFVAVTLDLEAGGAVRVVGGDTKTVRVQVTERGAHCADCVVAVTRTVDGIAVRTTRTRAVDAPADLQVEVQVPTQTNISLSSAGGEVEIEGIDGVVSGTTDFGALHLLRLSGAVTLETKRGDVSLRQSYVQGRVHTN